MPVKRKVWLIGLLIFCMMNLPVGCGKDSDGEVPAEPITFTFDPEAGEETGQTGEKSLIDEYGLDILPVVCVEAGTERLTAELFFASYSGQELVIGQELSAEELAVCGASYQIPVTYCGYDLEIEVDIIDTTAPEIVKLDDILVKMGDTIAYKKAVSYSDNSSNALTLEIDNSAVDVQTPGEYCVVYTVTDAGGNSAQTQVTLTVVEATSHTEDDVKELALAVLDEIYDPEASQYDNALTIFKWVHRSIQYTHSSGDRSSVWAGAYEGLHDGRGDCYAFYATYAVLLTYAGIENECVARVSDSSNHWWNLVNTGDGWYHCDTSPRRSGDGYFCFMQTDAQVEAYTRAYPEKPDYYTFDSSLLPERATTIIYGYDPDTIYQKYNTDTINRRLEELEAEEEDDNLTDEAEQFIDEEEEEEDVEAGQTPEAETDTEQASDTKTGTEADGDTDTESSTKKKKSKKKASESASKEETTTEASTESAAGGEAPAEASTESPADGENTAADSPETSATDEIPTEESADSSASGETAAEEAVTDAAGSGEELLPGAE